MAKYFLGSVGSAEAFRLNADGSRTFMFRATSLTDSGINITSSQDEIRGGTGAVSQFVFSHDASVELSLTDVYWKPEYVEAQLGVSFAANASDYQSETKTATASGITLDKAPITANLPCSENPAYLIWYSVQGSNEWQPYTGTVSENVLSAGFTNGTTYCIRYLANDEQAREAWVTSNIIPAELYLIITTPIYAGDSCSASNGQLAGHLTFEVPRFVLSGNLDMAFAMSSNTNMGLNGRALAYTDNCDLNGSKLLRIVENITGRKWYTGLKAIYISPDYVPATGTTVPVYGVYENGSVALLDDTATYNNDSAFTFAVSGTTLTVTIASGIINDSDSIAVTAGTTVGTHTGIVTLA